MRAMATSPVPPVDDVAAAPDTLCPQCQKPLVDPHGLGWCQACGYCGSLGAVVSAPKPSAAAGPEDAEASSASSTGQSPPWTLALLVGVVVLATATWAISRSVPLRPLPRATWTTVQVIAGVLVMLVGQCYGVIRVAPEEATLHAIDVIVPFRLYGMIFSRLPKLCSVLFFAAWGLTLIVTALLFVGGLQHWLTYLPKSK
jgi:hypothetical protein